MPPDSLHPLFRDLAPRQAVLVSRDPRLDPSAGTDDEEALISRAVSKRKNEFRAGRLCAHDALGALNVPFASLLTGPDREPLWPEGIVGSISHSNVLCVAAVARRSELVAIGIDTELDEALPEPLIPKICTPAEAKRPLHKQVFSAKEATYKCLHPSVKKFFGFHAAEVEFHGEAFQVRLLIDLPPYKRGSRFFGRHRTENGLIATVLSVPISV